MNRQIICIAVLVLFCSLNSRGQCTATLTIASSSCGVPALLKTEMNRAIQYLEWTQVGTGVVRRDTAVHAASAVTVIGTGTGGSALTQVNNPSSIFLHSNGSIYISEQGGNRVVRWDRGATQGVVVAGGNGNGSGLNQLSSPVGVHVGVGDTVYVLEYSNNRITKWGPGVAQGIIVAGGNGSGSNLNQLSGPHGFFVHTDGSIYIAEYSGGRIKKFPPGSTQSTNGTVVVSGLSNPVCLTVDQADNIYVGLDGGAIMKYPPGSSSGTTFATGSQRARAMFIDKYDNVWVSEDRNFRIVRYLPSGGTAKVIVGGANGTGASELFWPSSLMVHDSTGALYVADYGNHRIQRFEVGIRDTLTASAAGQYTIQAKGFSGCTSTDAITVSAGSSGIAVTPGSNPSVCVGATSASLPYSGATGSPNQYSIVWNTAAQTAGFANVTNQSLPGSAISISVPGSAGTGTYNGTLSVRNSTTGCASNAYNISVTLVAGAAIAPGGNPSVCAGVTSASLPYSGATGSPNQYSIAWNTAAQTAGFTNVTNQTLVAGSIGLAVPAAAVPALYNGSLSVRNSTTGCLSTAYNIAVTVNALPSATVSAAGSVELCTGDDTLLTAGSGAGYGYVWKNDQGTVGSGSSYNVSATGNYYVMVTDANNCRDSSAKLAVTVHPLPQVSIAQSDTAFCAGGFVRLDAISPDTGLDYRWREGGVPLQATANFIEITASGAYSVDVTRSAVAGCDNSSTPVTVTVYPLPVAMVAWDGEMLRADTGYTSYQWRISGQLIPGATNAVFKPQAQGAYSVTVTDTNGCTNTSAPASIQLGIATLAWEDIKIYPNPVMTVLHIEATVPVQAAIYSMEGRRVGLRDGTVQKIDLTVLPDGMYMLLVTDVNGVVIRKDKLVKKSL